MSTLGRAERELLDAAEEWHEAARQHWKQAQDWSRVSEEAAKAAAVRIEAGHRRLRAAARAFVKAEEVS